LYCIVDFNQGSHQLTSLFLGVVICCVVQLASSFNIDTVHPLVYEDPAAGQNTRRESYFGYSLQFLFNQKDNAHNSAKWLTISENKKRKFFFPL
jgi:hypothetical protein